MAEYMYYVWLSEELCLKLENERFPTLPTTRAWYWGEF